MQSTVVLKNTGDLITAAEINDIVAAVNSKGDSLVTPTAITYAATTNLDFDAANYQTLALTGNVTFTTSNKASGKKKKIKITSDASIRTFTFPAWVFVGGAAPANIAASKTAILTLECFGTADTDVVAKYEVQS